MKKKKKNNDEEHELRVDTHLTNEDQSHTIDLQNGEKHAGKERSHDCLYPGNKTTSPKKSHSNQEIRVPLIKIQASTPTDPEACSE